MKAKQDAMDRQAGPGGAKRQRGIGITLGTLAGAFMGVAVASWGLPHVRDALGIQARPINPLLTLYMDHYVKLDSNAPGQRPSFPPSLWQTPGQK